MTPVEKKIRKDLSLLIKGFVELYEKAPSDSEKSFSILGALAYLDSEHDLIPDDVPHIGYLDDLLVFFSVAKKIFQLPGENENSIAGLSADEVDQKIEEYNKYSQLIGQNVGEMSIKDWGTKGKQIKDVPELINQAKKTMAEIAL